MIQVTFAYLMPEQPAQGTGFYLDGEYAGYIGQDANGAHVVYFYRPFWQNTRIREARGYVMVSDRSAALSLVRRLVTRLAYRQLMSRARSICNSQCAKSFYQLILDNNRDSQRRLARVFIDQRTWNDPSQFQQKSDPAFTPECASQKEVTPSPFIKAVARVYPALTYNLIHYTDGSTRRVTAADIQASADPAFPLVRVACVSPRTLQVTPRAFFLPMTVPPRLLAGRHPAAPTTTRNTQ